jgi:bacteriorhodopsin
LAFCLFCLLFPTVLGDDMARRRWNNPQVYWVTALVPLFGPLGYLCLRPPISDNVAQ